MTDTEHTISMKTTVSTNTRNGVKIEVNKKTVIEYTILMHKNKVLREEIVSQ